MSVENIILKNNILLKGRDSSNKEYSKIELPARAKDLTGKSFGDLVALFPIRIEENKRLYWLCFCSCGKIKAVLPANLISGKIKSCGCLRSKVTSQHITDINYTRKINLINQTFGFLKVLEEDKEKTIEKSLNNKYTRHYWKCKCLLCGEVESVRADSLVSKQKVCCLNCASYSSQGEKEIYELLIKNNLSFVRQKTFPSCKLPSGWLAKFDFYIQDKVLVEFDGIQHFRETPNPYFNYKKIKESDSLKNQWCFQNNIPLIRIPYTKLGEITLQDLNPDETTFLVKGDDI